MANDFMRDFRDDDDELEADGPDWTQAIEEPAGEEDDEFERLRRRTVRAGAAFDEMSLDESAASSSTGGGLMASFTPAQRLILAVLVLLNIIVIGLGVLAMTGRI